MASLANTYTDTQSVASATFPFDVSGSITDGNFMLFVASHYSTEDITFPAPFSSAIAPVAATSLRMEIADATASSESPPYTLSISSARKWVGALMEFAGVSGIRDIDISYSTSSPATSPTVTSVSGDIILSGICCAGNHTLGIDGGLVAVANPNVAAGDGTQIKIGSDIASGATAGGYSHTNNAATPQSLVFTVSLTPSEVSGLAPTIIGAGTHAQTALNGETGVELDVSGWFNPEDGTISGYTFAGLPGGFTNGADADGVQTGITIDSDASDGSPYSCSVYATNENGDSTVENFTFTINTQVIISSKPVKLSDCDTTPALDSTATTYYKVYLGSVFDLATEVASGSGLTLDTGTFSITITDSDVTRGADGFLSLYDPTVGFSLTIPVTFT